jgi:hypothetical protein
MDEDAFTHYLSLISKNRIEILPHCYDSIFDRGYDEEWIYKCLLNQKPVKVVKQRNIRFKLF